MTVPLGDNERYCEPLAVCTFRQKERTMFHLPQQASFLEHIPSGLVRICNFGAITKDERLLKTIR